MILSIHSTGRAHWPTLRRNAYMAYWSQVRSRFTARLLAALLPALFTFAAGSSMITVSAAKTVVSARQRARRVPRRLPQQSESAV